ncbi:hypothetical protein M1328_04740 [Patescibacteria group bacterium]|nr:hypothetical protein [Patescibacteria group bacterium]
MKKEALFAIFLGIAFGGVLGLFLISKNKELQLNANKVIAPTGTDLRSPSQNDNNFQQLDISQPNDGAIVSQDSVTIKGSTTPNSLIVIQSPVKDMVFNNDKVQFQVDFPLVLGENVIKVTTYPKNKDLNVQEKAFKVYYLQEQL